MSVDVIIIGAGAAGLMCAIAAAKKGKRVTILEHANKAGKKILISGGGRCNFTNMYTEPKHYLCRNPHFCKSALSRYSPWDFIAEVDSAELPWHEEKVGHLFSDDKSIAILNMLLDQCEALGVELQLNCSVTQIKQTKAGGFALDTVLKNTHSDHRYQCDSLVIATGSLSFPTMGASDFGHRVAKQFGLNVTAMAPGLVPLTFDAPEQKQFEGLAGINFHCTMTCNGQSFPESLVFTHKGLSGPVTLQVSSFWHPGDTVTVNCLPNDNLVKILTQAQQGAPNKQLQTLLQNHLPQRFIASILLGITTENFDSLKPIKQYTHKEIDCIAQLFHEWQFVPSGTAGYKKAEVTVGGVDTDEISSKSFEAKKVSDLYFIGEVLDVTGWLGGFNFQWAWASGWCCGESL